MADQYTVRAIMDTERESWCLCPLDAADPEATVWRDGEWTWLAAHHGHGLDRVFGCFEDGMIVGKADLPFREARLWIAWAPRTRQGTEAARIMDTLCRHLTKTAEAGGAGALVVHLESAHPDPALAARSLLRAGFAEDEPRVVVRRALDDPPLPAPEPFECRPARTLTRDVFMDLSTAVGMLPARARLYWEDSERGKEWIVCFDDGRPAGLALLERTPGANATATMSWIGVRPGNRSRGLGKNLFFHALHQARANGANAYLDSTEDSNSPMRALFAAAGCIQTGTRREFRRGFGLLGDIIDGTGRLHHWPQLEADKVRALAWLAGWFELERTYTEREVDALIESRHRFGDRNLLRRELVDRGLLVRDRAGREYRKTERPGE